MRKHKSTSPDAIRPSISSLGRGSRDCKFAGRQSPSYSKRLLVAFLEFWLLLGSALAGVIAQVSRDIPEALLGDVRQALHDHVDDDGLAFPIEAHVVGARRRGLRAG